MSEVEHLRKLEELQIENKQLTERLFELSESIAKLKQARTLATRRLYVRSES